LHVRLAGRGLAVTAGLAILAPANAASGPLSLIPSLTAAALRYTAGGPAAQSVLPPRITALAEEVLRAMFLHRLKAGLILLIVFLGVLLAGGGLAVSLRANASSETEPPATGELPANLDEQARDKLATDAPRAVTVDHPRRREAAPYEDYEGSLEALRSVDVYPAASGVVGRVSFKAGADVQKGDVLFALDDRAAQLAVAKAEAELALAEARKKQADVDRQRIGRQAQAGAATTEELDKVMLRAADAEAGIKIAQFEVARARLDLEATKVVAPLSGRVGRPLVDAGTLVFRGQDRATVLTTVTSLDPIGLVFNMDEQSFMRYQRLLRENQVKGPSSALRMELAGEKGFPHEGMLESFDDRVHPKTGSLSVRASFPNPGRLLLPGMRARVRLPFGPPRAVLEVPEAAIQTDQARKYVLVVGDDRLVQRRAVTLGWADNGMRVVESGLTVDDWVVTAGLDGIAPGDRVEPRKKAAPDR
jgi:RND family efflux transporter MFP subunit